MALSKKLKKILADFYDVMDKYEAAFDRSDGKNALKYGREAVAYIEKFQKELNFSAEQINGLKNSLKELENSTVTAGITRAEAEAAGRKARKSEQKYYRSLLEQMPKNKYRTGH